MSIFVDDYKHVWIVVPCTGRRPGSRPFPKKILRLEIDDPIGAVPVHFVCGILGTLSLGLFATGAYGLPTPMGVDATVSIKGLFYGGGTAQLMSQATGGAARGTWRCHGLPAIDKEGESVDT